MKERVAQVRGVGAPAEETDPDRPRLMLVERVTATTLHDQYFALPALSAYAGVSVRALREYLVNPAPAARPGRPAAAAAPALRAWRTDRGAALGVRSSVDGRLPRAAETLRHAVELYVRVDVSSSAGTPA